MKKRNKIINTVIIFIVIGMLLRPEAGYALRPPLLFSPIENADQVSNYPVYRSHILIIHDLLSKVDSKTTRRKDVAATIKASLLSIHRDDSSLFTQKQASEITSLMKLGERLPLLEHLISYQVEENGKKEFLFNGEYITRLLCSSRSEAEIKSLIETLRMSGITDGTHITNILRSSQEKTKIERLIEFKRIISRNYPEDFVRNMLLRFAFMDDPMPLLRKIMSVDFDKAGLETEQPLIIRDLLSIVDNKEIKRKYISSPIKAALLSIQRGGYPLFTQKQAMIIASLDKLGQRLPLLEHLISYQVEEKGKKRFLFNSDHITKILWTSRSEAEIKSLIETLKMSGIEQGTHIARILRSSRKKIEIERLIEFKRIISRNYPEDFVRNMLLRFAFMDDPMPLLRKIMSVDFDKAGLETEQLSDLLSMADSEAIKREDIKSTIEAVLLSIQMDGSSLFTQKQAMEIAGLVKLGERLPLLEYLISYQVEEKGKKEFLFNGGCVTRILCTSRSEAEIKSLIETLRTLGITKGGDISRILSTSREKTEIEDLIELKRIISQEKNGGYPEDFVRKMLLKFAFMDDPMPLLRKIMSIDFKARLEVEQLPNLLSMVNDKTINRQDVKEKIKASLLSIQRDDSPLFTQKQAMEIASLKKLGERLPALDHLISYQVEEKGKKEFLFNGDHVTRILRSPRSETEIKSLIETLRTLGIERGAQIANILCSSRKKTEIEGLIELKRIISSNYPEDFVRDMLLRFAFIDDPMPLLRKIMSIDFDKAGLGMEQLPDLLSMANDKTINKIDIKAKIITALLSIQRGNSSLFTQKQAVKIASLKKLGERLPVLEHLISYQVEEKGKKEFLFNGDHAARILRSARKKTEIKRLIETLRGLGITEGIHIALILHSARKETEIERLIETLKGLGITEGSHIAVILQSSREEAEIESLIKTLKKLRIREGTPIAMILESSRKESEINRLIEILRRLGIIKDTHIAMILESSREEAEIESLVKTLKGLGIEEGAQIAGILHSSRKKTEIEGLIELKRIISQEKNGNYPQDFVRDMLLRFAFMDDPMPLLRKIMSIDFVRVRLEIEQLPINTTREQFEREYGNMSMWILKFFRKDFRSLRAVIRGYGKEFLLLDIMPDAEKIMAAPDSLEDNIENTFLKESLAKAIGRLSGAEQDAVAKFLEGYSEEEILSIYPDVSMPEVFAELREIIINNQHLSDSILPYYGPAVKRSPALKSI